LIYLLDACALLAWINEEKGKGYEKVDALFDRAGTGEITIAISIINLTEVYYGLIRDDGAATAGEIMKDIEDLPIYVIETVTRAVYREAARFKAAYSMSLADVFLCATAQSLSASIVTKDREIEAAEQPEGLSVFWIT
jgi:predicted nucleic acid-binding protein